MEKMPPRTDPRVLRTRQLLRDAFIELLHEMDIEKISVNRLTERATINRVTFYLHYRDIPDMLEKMADEMISEIRGVLQKTPASSNSPEEELSVLVHLLEHIAEHAQFYKAVLALKRIPIFTDRLLKLLAELVSARIVELIKEGSRSTDGIQQDIAIWYGSSALIGTIVSWLRNDMPYTPLYLAKQFYLLRTLPR
ncbi:DNA-binding transcriptional repressor AcrR [Paenibacillus konkukensis]|uniref:DNA-binding transcriptional repressor AcrR n=1 Tax=Paenibacillus konkukensis TaxID=2020716 RepID=A0ABY4RKS9_9BACL|nr:TetR-like C-terminal domain-containing protein [Paenibacillus konkukensis]UQZ82713.1 DNA-binding transcriptional repressor AcrR [Paenibacillus konkukensis]